MSPNSGDSSLEYETDSDQSTILNGERELTREEYAARCRVTCRRKEVPAEAHVDMRIIRTWQSACYDTHGPCCNERYSAELSRHAEQLLLVNVKSGTLVLLPSATPYIALSYVWGKAPIPKTTKSNLEHLKPL